MRKFNFLNKYNNYQTTKRNPKNNIFKSNDRHIFAITILLFLLSSSSTSLLCRFGNLSTSLNFLDGLDNANSHSLTHVTNSKTSKRSVVSKSFNTHWLVRSKPASPVFKAFGLSSTFFPVRRSTFSLSSANLQAM
uniref:Candidate secreted effector n=1 Tax=Meloidogyne incognita TaxID=6306 RepID=A0A914LWC4_MELIC